MSTEHEEIYKSQYGGGPNNFHVTKNGDTLDVELTYPPRSDAENTKNQCRYIFVDQESVRASDGIRLHYDYDRDGWVIEQEPECGEDTWVEVAFVQSWALERARAESGSSVA